MTSVLLSGIFMVGCIVLLIFFSYKGWGMYLAALICTFILAFASTEGFTTAMFTIFPQGAVGFIQMMILPVFFGFIYGFVLTASGASEAMANFLLKRLGLNKAPLIIFIATILFTLAGVPIPGLVIAPLSYSLMKRANLPNYIGLFIMCACSNIVVFGMPGIPHNMNLIPTNFLGTNMYAGGWIAIVSSIICLAATILLYTVLTNKARKQNVGFDVAGLYEDKPEGESNLPSFGIAVLPMILMFAICIVMVLVFKIDSTVAVCTSQAIAMIVNIITCRKYFSNGMKTVLQTLKDSFDRAATFLISCGCLTGFAAVAATTVFYNKAIEVVTSLDASPYFMVFITVAVVCAITSDSPGGLMITLNSMAGKLTSMTGVNLGLIHRIGVMTSCTFDSLPQAGSVFLYLGLFGYNHKKGYKYIFYGTVAITTLNALITTILATIFY